MKKKALGEPEPKGLARWGREHSGILYSKRFHRCNQPGKQAGDQQTKGGSRVARAVERTPASRAGEKKSRE